MKGEYTERGGDRKGRIWKGEETEKGGDGKGRRLIGEETERGRRLKGEETSLGTHCVNRGCVALTLILKFRVIYLCELVVPYVPRRVLRSAELNLLTVPPGKPGKYGSRSFARASANLWNSLRGERAAWLKNSPTLESFKRNLKTFLFWERFPS